MAFASILSACVDDSRFSLRFKSSLPKLAPQSLATTLCLATTFRPAHGSRLCYTKTLTRRRCWTRCGGVTSRTGQARRRRNRLMPRSRKWRLRVTTSKRSLVVGALFPLMDGTSGVRASNQSARISFAECREGREPIWLAAIWTERADGRPGCAIITEPARGPVKEIHDRMPLIFDDDSL